MPGKLAAVARQAAPGLRRKPTQSRAEQTLQLIFEATAQVLREEGEAALTTNRIAARAGLSIGTLYQYFDGKEAIVLALLSQTRARVMAQLEALMAEADLGAHDDPRELVRAYVRLYVNAFGTGARNQRELVRLAWRLDRHRPSSRRCARRASACRCICSACRTRAFGRQTRPCCSC